MGLHPPLHLLPGLGRRALKVVNSPADNSGMAVQVQKAASSASVLENERTYTLKTIADLVEKFSPQIDSNGDGSITRTELGIAIQSKNFDRVPGASAALVFLYSQFDSLTQSTPAGVTGEKRITKQAISEMVEGCRSGTTEDEKKFQEFWEKVAKRFESSKKMTNLFGVFSETKDELKAIHPLLNADVLALGCCGI